MTEIETVSGLSAYEMQVLLGTTISGCNMSPDRVFDLPAAWSRLYGLGLIDRTDGLAIATPSGLALINTALSRSLDAADGVGAVAWPPAKGAKVWLQFEVASYCSMGEPSWVGLVNEDGGYSVSYPNRHTLFASPPSPAEVTVTDAMVDAFRAAYIRVTGATMWPTEGQFREILAALDQHGKVG